MSNPATTARRNEAPTELVGQWRELLDRHAAVSCALEKALQHEHRIGLSEGEPEPALAET